MLYLYRKNESHPEFPIRERRTPQTGNLYFFMQILGKWYEVELCGEKWTGWVSKWNSAPWNLGGNEAMLVFLRNHPGWKTRP
jgi:hypothetical protein